MSFDARLAPAAEHERLVRLAIAAERWTVCPFGQAMLSDDVRDKLRRIDTPVRWLPDLLAVRGPVAYLVDAKTGRDDTPNYDIEESALVAHHNTYTCLRLPIVLVWHDFGCSFTWELLAGGDASLIRGYWSGNGSGTPFWLWPKAKAHPFTAIFGRDAPVYGPSPEWWMRDLRHGARP